MSKYRFEELKIKSEFYIWPKVNNNNKDASNAEGNGYEKEYRTSNFIKPIKGTVSIPTPYDDSKKIRNLSL